MSEEQARAEIKARLATVRDLDYAHNTGPSVAALALEYITELEQQVENMREREAECHRVGKRLEQEKAALRAEAEKQLVKLACAGVEKLTELAPNMGWDSGETVAEMYIRQLPPTDTGEQQ